MQATITYDDYLRSQFVYKPFQELNLKKVQAVSATVDKPKSQLCQFMFLNGHECIFEKNCIYAHSIAEIQENDEEFRKLMLMNQKMERKIFQNFGIWPTTIVLQYFTPEEIIQLSRINKEAHYISKKVFGTRKVELGKISLRLVKFFQRVEQIRISKESLPFFTQFKPVMFQQILCYYKNLRKFIINLNFIFEEKNVESLLDRLA